MLRRIDKKVFLTSLQSNPEYYQRPTQFLGFLAGSEGVVLREISNLCNSDGKSRIVKKSVRDLLKTR